MKAPQTQYGFYNPVYPQLQPVEPFTGYPSLQPQAYQQPTQYKEYVPQLTSEIHQSTEKLIETIKTITTPVLKQKVEQVDNTPKQAVPANNRGSSLGAVAEALSKIDLSRRETNILSNRTEVHNHYHQSVKKEKSNEEKSDAALRAVCVLVGTAVAGIFAFIFGKLTAKSEDKKDDVAPFEVLAEHWTKYNRQYYSQYPGFQRKVDEVIANTFKKTKREASSNFQDRVLSGCMITSGGLILGAGIIGGGILSTLVISAVALASISCIFKAGKYGYESTSQKPRKETEQLEKDLQTLDTMKDDFNFNKIAPVQPTAPTLEA